MSGTFIPTGKSISLSPHEGSIRLLDGTLSGTGTSAFASTFGLTASDGFEQEAIAQALAATLTLTTQSPPPAENRKGRRGSSSRRNKPHYNIPSDYTPTLEGLPRPLPTGTKLRFFNPTEEVAYCAPSESILATKGVLDHLEELQRDGPRSKAKMYLCTTFERSGRCLNGGLCREVHPLLDGMGAIDPSIASMTVHRRSAPLDAYPRLPSGTMFRLSLPNTAQPCQDVPSESIFVTKGACEYYHMVASGRESRMNMQHCAHFSKNGMCCYGPECQFVHVAGYVPPEKPPQEVTPPATTSYTRPAARRSKQPRTQAVSMPPQTQHSDATRSTMLHPMPYVVFMPPVMPIPWQHY